MHKPFRLGLLLLDLSKILMYEFWHYYGKPNYGEEVKLCYIKCVLLYTYKRCYLQRYCRRCSN